jgi:polysaccharide export outer membrane protein
MTSLRRYLHPGILLATLLVTSGLITGCETLDSGTTSTNNPPSRPPTSSDILNVGDLVTVVFSDTPTPTTPFEERVKDDGTITLLLNQTFEVAGKSRSQLEKEIRARYVPDYYVNLTVTVKPQERFYYVTGEVKLPSRQPYPGEITVTKAIATAGGLTDFAKKSKVRLTRANGQSVIVDYEAALEDSAKDLPVYPGDKINVPRSIL